MDLGDRVSGNWIYIIDVLIGFGNREGLLMLWILRDSFHIKLVRNAFFPLLYEASYHLFKLATADSTNTLQTGTTLLGKPSKSCDDVLCVSISLPESLGSSVRNSLANAISAPPSASLLPSHLLCRILRTQRARPREYAYRSTTVWHK